jgi:DNA polymerase elongation subunit (family B)
MNPELRDILFLDIETVSCVDHYSKLDDRLKVQWARKASFFKRDSNQTDEDLFHEKSGIYAEFGKIVAIAVGKYTDNGNGVIGLRTKCYVSHNEKELLLSFKTMLEKLDGTTRLCAHNGKEFDFPYISRRMLVNGIGLPFALDYAGKKPWEVPHLDTMELWKFGDYKHYTSLDLLAAIFNIPTSKGLMDGSQVNGVYYKESDLKKIADYCVGDVVVIAQLMLKMKGMELMEQKEIIYS